MKMADVYGWLQAGLPGLLAAGGVVFYAGTDHSAIAEAKSQVAAVSAQQAHDHDKVVALTENVKDVKADVAEIKADVKAVLQNQQSHR
jgi:hypothetical protein